MKTAPGRIRRFIRDDEGAAAAEFAMVALLLTWPMLNVVDLGVYLNQKMQVEQAAQVSAQAVWTWCDNSVPSRSTPAQSNCTGYAAKALTAAQSTSLGTRITVASGSPSFGFYCLDNSSPKALVTVGTYPGTKPTTCASVGSAADSPGEYAAVTVNFTYNPVFDYVTVASLLPTAMSYTARVRLV